MTIFQIEIDKSNFELVAGLFEEFVKIKPAGSKKQGALFTN